MATAYQAWSVVYGEQPSTTKWNIIGDNFAYIENALPQVGMVMHFWGDSTAIPGNYLLLNGQTISDADSDLNGLTLPDLTNKFTRNVTTGNVRTTPVAGGSDTDGIAHTHTGPSHTHTGPSHNHSLTDANVAFNGAGGNWQNTSSGGAGHLVVNGPSTTSGGTGATGAGGTGNTGAMSANSTVNTVPAYVGLVPVIRIK